MNYCYVLLYTLLLLATILLCVGAAFYTIIDMATLQFCRCFYDGFYCNALGQNNFYYAGECQPTQGYYYACTKDFNELKLYPPTTQLTLFDCYKNRHETGFRLLMAAAGVFGVCLILVVWKFYKKRLRKLRAQRLQEQQVQTQHLQVQQLWERQEQRLQEQRIQWERAQQLLQAPEQHEQHEQQDQQNQQAQQLLKNLPFLFHPAPAYPSNLKAECRLCFEVITVGYVCHQCKDMCYCYECQKKTIRASCPFCNEPFPAIAVVVSLA